ncbi:hypothetical protein H2200_001446 [Cladophialophora chaetospira]|uniref:Zinc finger PHD-type domain-containing protein n=1 Tax=Cladophialophora chaetospira TaxID=386627 RepID=A0AA39CP28_9EURO|nr:hypothetical protein H2200_001446 [Cladophialophora chaetospira]
MPGKGSSYQPGPLDSTRPINTKKRRRQNDRDEGYDEVDDKSKRFHVDSVTDSRPGLFDSSDLVPTSGIAASPPKSQLSASTKATQRKSPLITPSAYHATLRTLEKILRQRSISCEHGAAHENKERKTVWACCNAGVDKQEAEACDDPDCETIWYHRDCLRKELQDSCGRFRLWICEPCFFKRQREHSMRREQEDQRQAASFDLDNVPNQPPAESTDNTTATGDSSPPQAARSTSAESSGTDLQKREREHGSPLSDSTPDSFLLQPPEETRPAEEHRGISPQREQGDGSAHAIDNASQAERNDSDENDKADTTPARSSSNDGTQPNESLQQELGEQQSASLPDSETSPTGNRAQNPRRSIREGVEQRYANFVSEDPGVSGKAHRITTAEGIKASAKLWTSAKSSCYEKPAPQGGEIVIKYKHNEKLRDNNEDLGASAAVLSIMCCHEDDFRSKPAVEVPVRLLTSLSPSLHEYDVLHNKRRLARAAPSTYNGSIDVGRIDRRIVESAVTFMKGGALEVRLPAWDGHISYAAKKVLLQTADLAHKLDIPCLQRAALHAIYVSILRDATDWDNNETRWLLGAATLEGNPARDLDRIVGSIVLDNPHVLQQLPCEKEDREELCKMSVVSFGDGDVIQLDPTCYAGS